VTVSFDVKNTGSRAGAEIAQVYVGEPHPSLPRPVKELKGFAKVNLRAGESKHVALRLDRRAFPFYDVAEKDWHADSGEFNILIGGSSDNIQLRSNFKLTPTP
jgi:beta-glucosidase